MMTKSYVCFQGIKNVTLFDQRQKEENKMSAAAESVSAEVSEFNNVVFCVGFKFQYIMVFRVKGIVENLSKWYCTAEC